MCNGLQPAACSELLHGCSPLHEPRNSSRHVGGQEALLQFCLNGYKSCWGQQLVSPVSVQQLLKVSQAVAHIDEHDVLGSGGHNPFLNKHRDVKALFFNAVGVGGAVRQTSGWLVQGLRSPEQSAWLPGLQTCQQAL